MPSFSKDLWFQCQAFPKLSLAVLWDSKGLRVSKFNFDVFQTFRFRSEFKNAPHEPKPVGIVEATWKCDSMGFVFPKEKSTGKNIGGNGV
jgi:hypothetical protein